VLVTAIEARPLRSLERVRVELGPGIVSVVGPNGVGKTNLVEALYFALTGRSFRTSDRRDLIPFGGSLARAEATVRDDDGLERRLLASVSRAEGRRHLLDGSPADPATLARNRPPVAVFAPDRLSLIKGPPAERRAHLDGFLAARWPARSELRKRFGQALAQRNAMVARVAAGYGSAAGLDVWDAGVAEAAAPLVAARGDAVDELAPAFAAALAELGLEGGALEYAPRAAGDAAAIRAGLLERRDADIKLGRSSWGPHLDELKVSAGGRALRRYGSQGQQRAALLALLFAERDALLAARRVTPLLLLDDVMSELDPGRRERLVARLASGGQTLITAADEESLPAPALATVVRMPPPGSVVADNEPPPEEEIEEVEAA
jgi:DNA replication and repair protein RecF